MTMFEALTSYRALEDAYRRARRGKRGQRAATAFHFDYELRLLALQRELRERRYEPRPYRYFQIRDPKPRTISVAAFRDRVVHHALIGAIEPVFEAGFYRHSYACRVDKGTHRAIHWCQHYARRFPYVLKLDVQRFFDHVDHGVLLGLLGARITDPDVLWLCRTILAHARVPSSSDASRVGIPIGNLTSQFWGNVMLDPLDQMLVERRPGRVHVRYMDDVLCFGHTRSALWETRDAIDTFLRERLRVSLKESATRLLPVTEGVPFLGCRVYAGLVRLDRRGLVRATRKLRACRRAAERGGATEDALQATLAAVTGHLAVADTLQFRRSLPARTTRLATSPPGTEDRPPWDEATTAPTA